MCRLPQWSLWLLSALVLESVISPPGILSWLGGEHRTGKLSGVQSKISVVVTAPRGHLFPLPLPHCLCLAGFWSLVVTAHSVTTRPLKGDSEG